MIDHFIAGLAYRKTHQAKRRTRQHNFIAPHDDFLEDCPLLDLALWFLSFWTSVASRRRCLKTQVRPPACQVDFLVFSETVLTKWLKPPHNLGTDSAKLSPLISERGSMRAHHASNHFGRHVQCTRRTPLFGFGLARLAAAHFFVIQTQAPACTRKS